MRTATPFARRRIARGVTVLCLFAALFAGSGCTYYRSLGKGQRLAPPRTRPHHELAKGGEEIILAVTTDAAGAVSNVEFVKRSKSEGVNGYLVETIRSGWPAIPSVRTVTRIKHTSNGGFTDPEVISRTPVQ